MTLFIDIPKEFVPHFEEDKFAESLERVKADIHYNLTTDNILSAGNYELELIEVLIKAFKDCKRVNTTTISDAPLMEREQLEQTEEMKNKCSTLLDKLYLSGLKPNQVALVERMQDVLGV